MKSLFVIGDSISIQYGPYLEQALGSSWSYARKEGLSEALVDLNIPTGANGGDSSMVLPYVTDKCAEATFQPDVLLLNCGLHDIKSCDGKLQVELDAYKSNLQAIIDLIADTCQLVWVRSTPVIDEIHNDPENNHSKGALFKRFAKDLEAYNSAADEIMEAADIMCIDLYGFTKTLGPDAYCDHVHFHEEVRKQQGAYIAKLLIEAFP